MKFGAWATVALLACLASQSQVFGDIIGPSQRSVLSDKYFSLAASSSLKTNLGTLDTSVTSLSKTLSGLKTTSAEARLTGAAAALKAHVEKSTDLATKAAAALRKMIDPTTPVASIFTDFGTVKALIDTEFGMLDANVDSFKTSLGCARAQQFKSATNSYETLGEVAVIITQLKTIVDAGSDPSPATTMAMKSLIDTLSAKLKTLNDRFTAYVTFVKNAVSGVEMANSFMKDLETKETKANTDMATAGTQAVTSITTQATSIKNKFTATKRSIATDLTNAITSLNIFANNVDLKALYLANSESYTTTFVSLEARLAIDTADADVNYNLLGTNMKTTIASTVTVFIKAVKRVGRRLADVLLDGAPTAASCFSTYNSKLSTPYAPLATLVSSCVMKETTRLTAVGTAVESMLKLTQEDSKELAANLGRCAKYVNYATSSEDADKAKACMTTNKEYLDALFSVQEPQIIYANQLVKRETLASFFRFQNCLVTNTNEAVQGFTAMRTAIANCADPFDGCTREPYNNLDEEMITPIRKADDGMCKVIPPP